MALSRLGYVRYFLKHLPYLPQTIWFNFHYLPFRQAILLPIEIGDNNWFAMKSIVLKGTKTPDYYIVGANSLLSKDYSDLPSYCLISGRPAQLRETGVYLDRSDNAILYE